MRFSIIVPVYNADKYLSKCIDSILSQSYTDYEVILVNDGSTDQSGTICDLYKSSDNRVVVLHQTNKGQSVARNNGIKLATGQYLLFLDSDDWWNSNDLLKKINDNITDDIDIVFFGLQKVITNNDRELVKPLLLKEINEYYHSGQAFLDDLLLNNPQFSWYPVMYAFKSELWKEVRFPEGLYYEDLATIFKPILLAKGVIYLNEVFYNYRKTYSHSTTALENFKSINDLITAFVSSIRFVESLSLNESLRKKLLANFSLSYYSALIRCNSLPTSERDSIINRLQDVNWVLNYVNTPKQLFCNYLIKLFGLNSVSKLLGLRRIIKSI